nr:MAG TPA: Regulatory protein [Caudoviricetes sp.]DAX52134.1 MAG TPA: Regulatory protein [Caudoviricetes sp.]
MINVNALKGKIAERGKTQTDVAKAIGIAPKTFYDKMSKGVFGSDEIEIMIDYLSIEDPMKIFFGK